MSPSCASASFISSQLTLPFLSSCVITLHRSMKFFVIFIILVIMRSESRSVMSDSLWESMGLYSPWHSPGQNTGVGSLSLLQGIFPTHGLNPGLLHCRQILYQLSHKGRPRILEWVAYPFSSGSSRPRNWTGVSCIRQVLYQLNWFSWENLWKKNKGLLYYNIKSGTSLVSRS